MNLEGLRDELALALMCDRLQALPSQVLAEDYWQMTRTWNLLGEIDRIRSQHA